MTLESNILKHSIIKTAVKAAKMVCNHKHRHGAVIFKGSHVISSGRNFTHKYSSKVNTNYIRWIDSIHAEVDAIIHSNIRDCKRASILVIRLNNNDDFRLSKPCSHCLSLIHHVGIKKIYYSINIYPFFELIEL